MTSTARVPRTRAVGARPLLTTFVVLLTLSGAACGSPTTAEQEPVNVTEPTTSVSPSPTEAEPSATAAGGDVTRVDATEPVAASAVGTPPASVAVPDLGIQLPVVPVGVAPDGQTEVPADALDAGWYRFGPGVGADRGATVILAHAGSVITPRGPFSELDDLQGGELVSVTDATGVEHSYQVTSVEVLEKLSLDLSPYFVRDGDPHLVLITCGGQWDEAASSYRSNVIVTAVPVGSR